MFLTYINFVYSNFRYLKQILEYELQLKKLKSYVWRYVQLKYNQKKWNTTGLTQAYISYPVKKSPKLVQKITFVNQNEQKKGCNM